MSTFEFKNPTKEYMVTLSTGAPKWLTSKWIVEAEEKSQALHFAMLMHDDPERDLKDRWSIEMVTLSYRGANPSIDESQFAVSDPEKLFRLFQIYKHGKERLENC
jgi:hypothetical protein